MVNASPLASQAPTMSPNLFQSATPVLNTPSASLAPTTIQLLPTQAPSSVQAQSPVIGFVPSSIKAPTVAPVLPPSSTAPTETLTTNVPVVNYPEYNGPSNWSGLQELTLQGLQPYALLGRVFASNSDGSVIAVTETKGSPISGITVVHVYKISKITNIWLEIGRGMELDQDRVYSLSVSDDGFVLALGLESSALVFRYNPLSRGWVLSGSPASKASTNRSNLRREKLRRRKLISTDESGVSVSVSTDGNTIATGLISSNTPNTQNSTRLNVYVAVYDPDTDNWESVSTALIRRGNYVGVTVDLSSNGQLLAVSHQSMWNYTCQSIVEVLEFQEGNQTGLFRAPSTWDHIGEMLSVGNSPKTSLDLAYANDGGHRLAISGEGITSAQVYEFNTTSTAWISLGTNSSFGPGLDISMDRTGTRVALQRPDRVSIFDYDVASLDWVQTGEIASVDMNITKGGDLQNWNIALSADGSQLLCALPYYDDTSARPDAGQIMAFGTELPIQQ
jgi:hypothetical protein